jgi:hypothetical protein
MSELRGFDGALSVECADVTAVTASPIDQWKGHARRSHPIQLGPTGLPRNTNKTFPFELGAFA